MSCLRGVGSHRAAPHQGVGGADEEADGHQLHVHRIGRQDIVRARCVVVFGVGHVPFRPEHLGLRGSVDIGVEDADAVAHVAERDGEIGRNGRFAYSALARSDGDDMGDAVRRGALLGGLCRLLRLALADEDRDAVAQGGVALPEPGGYLVFDFEREGVASLSEAECDGDFFGVGRYFFDDAAADDSLARLGMDDAVQQLLDGIFHVPYFSVSGAVAPVRGAAAVRLRPRRAGPVSILLQR